MGSSELDSIDGHFTEPDSPEIYSAYLPGLSDPELMGHSALFATEFPESEI